VNLLENGSQCKETCRLDKATGAFIRVNAPVVFNNNRSYALEQEGPENMGGVWPHASIIFGIFYELRKS
jgi:hypothetical protein